MVTAFSTRGDRVGTLRPPTPATLVDVQGESPAPATGALDNANSSPPRALEGAIGDGRIGDECTLAVLSATIEAMQRQSVAVELHPQECGRHDRIGHHRHDHRRQSDGVRGVRDDHAGTPGGFASPLTEYGPPSEGIEVAAPPPHLVAIPTGEEPEPGKVSIPLLPPDLIITGTSPAAIDDGSADALTLAAGHALRPGGVLTVLTHSHHIGGALVDPGGVLVTAAQNADLLYLQHIVVLAAAVLPTATRPDTSLPVGGATTPVPISSKVDAGQRIVRHRRVHADLYVFGQPHYHHTTDDPPPGSRDDTDQADGAAGLRDSGAGR
jgi:hypothetical protein